MVDIMETGRIFIHWDFINIPPLGQVGILEICISKGTDDFDHHITTLFTKISATSFIPLFTAENFDGQEITRLFKFKFLDIISLIKKISKWWNSRLSQFQPPWFM